MESGRWEVGRVWEKLKEGNPDQNILYENTLQ